MDKVSQDSRSTTTLKSDYCLVAIVSVKMAGNDAIRPEPVEGRAAWFDKPVLSLPKGSPRTVFVCHLFLQLSTSRRKACRKVGAKGETVLRISFSVSLRHRGQSGKQTHRHIC